MLVNGFHAAAEFFSTQKQQNSTNNKWKQQQVSYL